MLDEKLNEVGKYFQMAPMKMDQFDDFYVQADNGRAFRTIDYIKESLQSNPGGSLSLYFYLPNCSDV
jgi:hypothetical protein